MVICRARSGGKNAIGVKGFGRSKSEASDILLVGSQTLEGYQDQVHQRSSSVYNKMRTIDSDLHRF